MKIDSKKCFSCIAKHVCGPVVTPKMAMCVNFRKAAEALKILHNTGSPKLPTIEECYQDIPFPSDDRECAMFVAGIAECHKFIVGRKLRGDTAIALLQEYVSYAKCSCSSTIAQNCFYCKANAVLAQQQ